jgi:hypothetical protein
MHVSTQAHGEQRERKATEESARGLNQGRVVVVNDWCTEGRCRSKGGRGGGGCRRRERTCVREDEQEQK